ncbi:MAG: class I SAM-dependent methyltransferase [Planctomycetota bacterium]|nr:class I SAM-dependent methyltransferase [Planctomycetaceae bacterium]MDQ3329926.1 class I SAM-dependent methyltransferase [Planctomycetota bacterium]
MIVPATSPSTAVLDHATSVSEQLLAVCWRQWRTERSLRKRGIDFRTTVPGDARRAYSAMTPAEFAAVNGRQAWANRRTIASSLAGLIPDRPLLVLDLGCGIGESTRVLASLVPAGSKIIGIEFAPPLVEVANELGARAAADHGRDVRFVVGSVVETFFDDEGAAVADETVDVVNASGIVGHHLDPPDAESAADEIFRVLRNRGIAALDVGPKLSARQLTTLMSDRGFERVRRTRSNPFDRTGQVVFRKR